MKCKCRYRGQARQTTTGKLDLIGGQITDAGVTLKVQTKQGTKRTDKLSRVVTDGIK